MADKALVVSNFKYGLDARREQLVSQPGTLVTANNCHVNPGGELEKRLAFVADTNSYPINTYGLQDTDSGLVTFGSDASPVTTLPTGVTYQRLQLPVATYIPVSNPPVPDSMIGVVFSCNFLGKAFVLARFTNGVFGFYNGTLVAAFRNGLVLQTQAPVSGIGETVTELATDLAGNVALILGWVADANVNAILPGDSSGYREFALNGSVLIMSPPGVHFTPTPSQHSTSGVLAAKLVDQDYAGVAAVGASVAFTLNAGNTGGVTLTAPATAAGTGTAALTNGAIAFNTSLAQTAADVAAAVNNYTFVHGYTANSNGAIVTVNAPSSFGAFTYNLTVVTTGTLTTAGGAVATFTMHLQFTNVNAFASSNIPASNYISASNKAIVSGAINAPTYVWEPCNADGSTANVPVSNIVITNPTAGQTRFAATVPKGESYTGYFKCTATSIGATPGSATAICSIHLINNT